MRLVAAFLVALAMLVSPLAMASGSAAVMPHDGMMPAMAAADHCSGSEAPADKKTPDTRVTCAVACAAFPALPPVIDQPGKRVKALHSAAGPKRLTAIKLDGETPPPRTTPRI